MSARLRPVLLLGTSAALALGLSACKLDNRPLLSRDAAQPVDYAYAPSATALPYAQPAQVLPAADAYDGYALAQRAYAHDRVAYREPPEYGFQYGGVEPWVWQAEDDDLMFAEPIDDGYRFYYYEPGEAYPYFVRDRDYGYAYGSGGVLAALFDATGALLPQDRLYSVAPTAGRYLARGHDLRQVYYREPRIAVPEPAWTRRAPVIEAAQRPWIAAAERQPAFRERPPREVRTFDPIPGPREQEFADRRHEDRRRDDRRAFAPNVQQHAAQASARIEEHQARDFARDQRRAVQDQARAARQLARAEPPKTFDRHGGGRHEERAAPQAAPQPQGQAFNAPHGGGNGHHQDRPAPAPSAPAAPAQPQGGGEHGHGDHGNHGGGDKGHPGKH